MVSIKQHPLSWLFCWDRSSLHSSVACWVCGHLAVPVKWGLSHTSLSPKSYSITMHLQVVFWKDSWNVCWQDNWWKGLWLNVYLSWSRPNTGLTEWRMGRRGQIQKEWWPASYKKTREMQQKGWMWERLGKEKSDVCMPLSLLYRWMKTFKSPAIHIPTSCVQKTFHFGMSTENQYFFFF
jgi:hypothetical protein